MEVLLIRHAQTPGNLEHRYIGRTDQPLSPEGERAAREVTGLPEAGVVYISPMLRARRTAELMFPDARMVPVDGLREMDFGDFEGKSFYELENDAAYSAWVSGGCEDTCPNGEDKESFSSRTCEAFELSVRKSLSDGENQLIIVAHGGTIMAVMSRYARPERGYYEWLVPNCGGWRAKLAVDENGITLTDYVRL